MTREGWFKWLLVGYIPENDAFAIIEEQYFAIWAERYYAAPERWTERPLGCYVPEVDAIVTIRRQRLTIRAENYAMNRRLINSSEWRAKLSLGRHIP